MNDTTYNIQLSFRDRNRNELCGDGTQGMNAALQQMIIAKDASGFCQQTDKQDGYAPLRYFDSRQGSSLGTGISVRRRFIADSFDIDCIFLHGGRGLCGGPGLT